MFYEFEPRFDVYWIAVTMIGKNVDRSVWSEKKKNKWLYRLPYCGRECDKRETSRARLNFNYRVVGESNAHRLYVYIIIINNIIAVFTEFRDSMRYTRRNLSPLSRLETVRARTCYTIDLSVWIMCFFFSDEL